MKYLPQFATLRPISGKVAALIPALVASIGSGYGADSLVQVTSDSGAGSLRAAFSEVASNANSSDNILFSSLFNSPQAIALASSMPSLTKNAGFALTMAPPAALTVNSGAFTFLNLSGSGVYNISNVISQGSNAGAITVNGGATLNASNFSFENMTLNGGRFQTSGSLTTAGKILLGASSTIDVSGTTRLSGEISGAGGLTKSGSGQLTLSGNNSYAGGTTITSGMLGIASNAALGTGDITITGGGIRAEGEMRTLANSLFTSGTFTLGRSTNFSSTTTLLGNTTIIASNPDGPANADSIFGGPIVGNYGITISEGAGGLGTGAIVFSGSNSYTGGTTISSGALQLGTSGTSGSVSGNIANDGSLRFNRSDAAIFSGTISGGGSVSQIGTGTTILTANHTYTGTTFISGGALQLGDGGTTGSLSSSAIANNSSLTFNRSDAVSYAGTISGTGRLTKLGTGAFTLSGSNSYSGGTTIGSGTLSLGNAYALGSGNIQLNGGSLDLNGQANVSGGSLVIGSGATLLNSSTTSAASYAGNISPNGTIGGPGNITLSGTLNGALTKAGTGTTTLLGSGNLSSSTVNRGVLNISGGSFTTNSGTTTIGGNGGTLAVTNGGNLTGNAIFVGQSGTGSMLLDGGLVSTGYLYIGTIAQSLGSVTIASGTLRTSAFPEIGTNGTGSLTITGGLFDAQNAIFDLGYRQTGHGILTVTGGTATGAALFNVGLSGTGTLLVNGGFLSTDESNIGAGTTGTGSATVSSGTWESGILSVRRGTLNVTDTGVVRTSANGIDLASTGTINFGTGGAAGTIDASSIKTSSEGTLNFNHTGLATFAPVLSGSLRVNKLGSGTTAVTSNSVVTGTITISQGALQFGNGGTTGWITSTAMVNNGKLAFNRSDAVTYAMAIGGSGGLAQNGSGKLTLTGSNSYTGATELNAGVLSVGALSNIGSGPIVMNGGSFQWASGSTFDISSRLSAQGSGGTFDTNGNNVIFASGFSGTGSLVKAGGGVLTVTGSNSHSGTFVISGGALRIGSGGTTGSLGSSSIINSATLLLNRSDAVTYGGNISGSGMISMTGSGTFTLSGSNTFTGTNSGAGGITISAGQLRLGSASALPGGDLTIDSGSLDLNGYSGTISNLIGNNAGRITSGTTGGVTLTVNPALAYGTTFAGVIEDGSGTVSLHNRAGALTLAGNNTYTGTTTISGGSLTIAGSLASSAIVNNSLLIFNTSSGTYAGVISGTGLMRLGGISTLTLTGNNTYTGTTTIFSGTLQIGNGGTSGSLAGAFIENGSALAFNRSDAVSYGGVISGTGRVSQLGTGTLTLIGANTYTGTTTIAAGTLQIGNGGTSGSIASTGIANSSTLAFNRSDAVSYAGVITGSGGLWQAGTGTLVLSGSNAYTGGTTVKRGTVRLGNDSALGRGGLTLDGGTLDLAGRSLLVTSLSGSTGGVVTSSTAGAYVFTSSQSANTSFAGTLQNGAGEMAFVKSGSGTLSLTGSNSYTGGTTLNAGTLALAHGSALGTSGTIRFSGGTLQFTAANTSDYSSRFSTATGQSFLLDTNGQSVTLATGFGSSGSTITKLGSGTLTLTGESTYGVITYINGGVLQIGNGGTTGSIASPAIANNATLTFNRNDAASYAGTISGTGALIQAGTGTLVLTGSNTSTGTTTVSAGVLQIGSGSNTGAVTGVIVNNSEVVFNRSDFVLHGARIGGSGSVTSQGSGVLLLTGSNTYTGGTTIVSGTLIKQHNNAMGTGAVEVDGGVFFIPSGVSSTTNAVILAGGGYERALAGGTSLANAINATSHFAGGPADTTAKILQGTLATSGTLSISFSEASNALNDEIRLSDVYHFAGTGSSVFVLELSMSSVEAGSYLAWLDTSTNTWVNAVDGNTGTNNIQFISGAYDGNLVVGHYGVDTANGTVWAVLNHNSAFAIVPEPGTCALLVLGGMALLVRRRR
jgi:fibronectin-binding autotransporter adhesin